MKLKSHQWKFYIKHRKCAFHMWIVPIPHKISNYIMWIFRKRWPRRSSDDVIPRKFLSFNLIVVLFSFCKRKDARVDVQIQVSQLEHDLQITSCPSQIPNILMRLHSRDPDPHKNHAKVTSYLVFVVLGFGFVLVGWFLGWLGWWTGVNSKHPHERATILWCLPPEVFISIVKKTVVSALVL